jgi:hypothetical protein
MRRWLALPAVLLVALACSAGEAKDPLAAGNDLPGTFHPFNVNEALPPSEGADDAKDQPPTKHKIQAHSTRGKFHSLISEYDLEPVVMLFAKGGLDDNAAFGKLLQGLDTAIERNRKGARLHAFVVFVYDDLTDVLGQDDLREQHARRLEKLAEDLKLRWVVLTLAGKPDLAKYRLGDDALTAVLYRKLKIAATHKAAGADKVDDAAKAILADAAGKLGASR